MPDTKQPSSPASDSEFAVIGGGLVGMALAYGLQRRGCTVTVFDEGDVAFRASRGNFGLVWVQGKGANLPDYARWTRQSARDWPEFARGLEDETGIAVEHDQPGGITVGLTEAEIETRVGVLTGLREALGGDYPFEVLGHNQLREMIPEIGRDVSGAIYCREDGHANPLYLLRALHAAFKRRGGRLVNGAPVGHVAPEASGFGIRAGGYHRAEKLVLAAGHGNSRLAPGVGIDAPLVPQRGQVMVTERLRRFLRFPTLNVRQVGEGAVQIGDSKEDVGFDDGTTPDVLATMARRAIRTFPLLEDVRMVRAWAALRILSPDGCPIYQASETAPGAFLVNCHSGVTLAAAHALSLSGWLAGGPMPDHAASLGADRFHVRSAA